MNKPQRYTAHSPAGRNGPRVWHVLDNHTNQLVSDTMSHQSATYLAASFRTLDKHAQSGAFDPNAALRLLRRNARDIAPRATYLETQRIARSLLSQWRNRATCNTSINSDSE